MPCLSEALGCRRGVAAFAGTLCPHPGSRQARELQRTAMDRGSDPVRITIPPLREFAFRAAWIATATAAATDLAEILVDVPPNERALPDFRTPWPWQFDSVAVAL